MQPVKINCTHCNHPMEYWTKSDTIFCPECKGSIKVEPCVEMLDDEMEGEIDASTI